MLSQRYPNKSWAMDYNPATLRNHVDWLLGEHVAEPRAVSPSGEEAEGPSWPVVLRYELEVRKKAMRQINMFGVSLATAFAAGRRSDELRTRYFITPLALGGTQKKQQDNRPAEERSQKQKVQQPRQQPSTQSGPKRKGARQRAAKRQFEAGSTLTETRDTTKLEGYVLTLSIKVTMGSLNVSRSKVRRDAREGSLASISTSVRTASVLTRTRSVPSTLNRVRPT